jgi:hypothetical protein
MAKRLSLKAVTKKFLVNNPHGRITKVGAISYEVLFDARDNRSQVDHDLQDYYQINTDTRIHHTYQANHLLDLANMLKLDVTDILDKINEYNAPSEPIVRPANYDPDFLTKLFGVAK